MSHEYSVDPVSDHEELSDDLKKQINPILDKLTVTELRCLLRYVSDCANNACEAFEDNVTIEDFEKAHKIDADKDNEEGEY